MDQRQGKTPEDYYQYYSKFHGWAVNFLNNRELPVAQVKVLFSKWGKVNEVRQTGSAGGYCFVHFETKESARQCVLDMKNDSIIKLRFFNRHSTKNSNGSVNGNNHSNVSGKPESSEKAFSLRMPLKSKLAAEIFEEEQSGQSGNLEGKNDDLVQLEQLSGNSIHSEIKNGNSTALEIKNGNPKISNSLMIQTKVPAVSSQPLDSSKTQIEPKKSSNCQKNLSDSALDSKETVAGASNESPIAPKVLTDDDWVENSTEQDLSLLSSNQESSDSDDLYTNLPNLVKIDSKGDPSDLGSYKLGSPEEIDNHFINSIPAEEVIVANIHEICSLEFILDLFAKYEPICATNIGIIPMYKLRYCHVYFKSSDDAEAIEKIYDDTKIFGSEEDNNLLLKH